jgi:hypothetical protein
MSKQTMYSAVVVPTVMQLTGFKVMSISAKFRASKESELITV